MEQHETATAIVGDKIGVRAICVTCHTELGPVHGVPDGMNNLAAMGACFDERDEHERPRSSWQVTEAG